MTKWITNNLSDRQRYEERKRLAQEENIRLELEKERKRKLGPSKVGFFISVPLKQSTL